MHGKAERLPTRPRHQRNSSAYKTTLIHILGLGLEAQVLGLGFIPKSLLASLSCPTTAQDSHHCS